MLSVNLAHRLIKALVESDTAVLDTILPANAYLQLRGNGRMQLYWTRARVRTALLAEFARWHKPTVTIGDVSPHTTTISVTFQIEVAENGRLTKYDYFALLVPRNGQVQTIILYCYHNIASACPDSWTFPLPKDRLFESRTTPPKIGTFCY